MANYIKSKRVELAWSCIAIIIEAREKGRKKDWQRQYAQEQDDLRLLSPSIA